MVARVVSADLLKYFFTWHVPRHNWRDCRVVCKEWKGVVNKLWSSCFVLNGNNLPTGPELVARFPDIKRLHCYSQKFQAVDNFLRSFLVQENTSLMRISSEGYPISLYPSLAGLVELKFYDSKSRSAPLISSTAFTRFLEVTMNLQHLSFASHGDSSMFFAVAAYCRQLLELEIGGWGLTSNLLLPILAINRIQSLTIHWDDDDQPHRLDGTAIPENCSIQFLTLDNFTLDSEALRSILSRLPILKSFSIFSYLPMDQQGNGAFTQVLCETCPDLISLELMNLSTEEESIIKILESKKHLQVFSFELPETFSQNFGAQLTSSCASLEKIHAALPSYGDDWDLDEQCYINEDTIADVLNHKKAYAEAFHQIMTHASGLKTLTIDTRGVTQVKEYLLENLQEQAEACHIDFRVI